MKRHLHLGGTCIRGQYSNYSALLFPLLFTKRILRASGHLETPGQPESDHTGLTL